LDPAVIGDVANDFSVDAGDISTIAAFTVHLSAPAMPPIPTGLTITPVGADPTLSLGQVGRISNPSYGGIVSVPVLLDHPHPLGSTGMTEAVLALTFDPKVLSVSAADITLGNVPALVAGWQISSEVDQATGQIGIALYSTTAITATQAGSLVNIVFHLLPGVTAQTSPVQLVSRVMPNGHEFTTQVDDAQGQFVLSPGLDRLVVPTGASAAVVITPRDTLVLQTPSVINQRDSAERGDSEETAGAVSLDLAADDAVASNVASNGEVAAARVVPAPVGGRGAFAFPANQATVASSQLAGQVFLVGGSALPNMLLVKNSPEQGVADWLVPTAGKWMEIGGDSATQASVQDNPWDALSSWLPALGHVVNAQPDSAAASSTSPAEGQSTADPIAVVNRAFAQQWEETNDFSDD
jgi:hypothetical protein